MKRDFTNYLTLKRFPMKLKMDRTGEICIPRGDWRGSDGGIERIYFNHIVSSNCA